MLGSTLLNIPSIGKVTEEKFWKMGLITLEETLKYQSHPKSIKENIEKNLQRNGITF